MSACLCVYFLAVAVAVFIYYFIFNTFFVACMDFFSLLICHHMCGVVPTTRHARHLSRATVPGRERYFGGL